MEFAQPQYLFLLLLLLPAIAWYILKQRRAEASLQVSSTAAFKHLPRSYKTYLRHLLFVVRMAVISLLIIVIARPQSLDSWKSTSTEGIDIMLALDISTSMLAEDFQPNRIASAKEVAAQFVTARENDNIGLAIFAGESFTMCPMTTDHATLLNLLKEVQPGMIEDMTAIGSGIATSVSRLKESEAKSKVIILLTDGTNNAGDISPLMASEIAQTFGIRIYTIGVGTNGTAPYPVQTPYGSTIYQDVKVEIDEATLQEIATKTGGVYFRATNEKTLENIFEEIDQLETSKISTQQFSTREEEYYLWALLAICLLAFEMILRNTLLKNIP